MGEPFLTRCPVCRARLAGDEPLAEPCRRCGADLALVRTAERQAAGLRESAAALLRSGDAPAAATVAARSLRLVDTPEGRTLLQAALAGTAAR